MSKNLNPNECGKVEHISNTQLVADIIAFAEKEKKTLSMVNPTFVISSQ